jgi:hypothetical protein
MHFEQAKKVLQLTDARIRKFGSTDTSTSHEIHEAISKGANSSISKFLGAANSHGNQSQSRRVSRICPS